jgi:hypothetical protein
MLIEGHDKDGFWLKGPLESLPTLYDVIRINGNPYSLKEIDPSKKTGLKSVLKVGMIVKLTFPHKNRYYAKDIEVTEETEMKQKDFSSLVKEIEPLYKELVSLNEGEKRDLLAMFQHSLDITTSLYSVHASYDDTKKDVEDVLPKLIEVAYGLTLVEDANTLQILKKHIK